MATTFVRPANPALRAAIRLAGFFALLKLAIHIAATLWQVHLGYGYFRDEFYYIACGRHLAWGYVDHGPIVALQARLGLALFGKSLLGVRLLSALAGAGRVFLTGLLCWAMGGGRPAQGLSMTGVLILPVYFAVDGYLCMNSFESLFWMTCILCLVVLLRRQPENRGYRHPSLAMWLLWGSSAGIGLLNKPSMTFFLIALLAGLVLSPQRGLLFHRDAAIGVAVMLAIVSPNVMWQIHHHWPTLEFLENGRRENKNVALGPLAFLGEQILVLQPANLLIWGAGLVRLLRNPEARPYRWMGYTFLVFFTIMFVLHGKNYYVAPIYPMLFAAGGIAWERRFSRRSSVAGGQVFAFPVLQTVLIVAAALLLPLSFPILRPAAFVAYGEATHLAKAGNTENGSSGPLPQFYADRFGWQEEVDLVTRAYNALPPQERSVACLWGSNYGEAGALDFLGKGLPPAMSGHNNYFLWGDHGCTGEIVISVTPTPLDKLRQEYDSAEVAGHLDNPWAMPFEHRSVVVLRHRKRPIPPDWPGTKDYI